MSIYLSFYLSIRPPLPTLWRGLSARSPLFLITYPQYGRLFVLVNMADCLYNMADRLCLNKPLAVHSSASASF